ncbi:MAG: pilin [bacterium]|nr:pilin [bacterium]
MKITKILFLFPAIFLVSALLSLGPDNFSSAASVSLTGQPSSGTAPLPVILTANIADTSSGPLTYYFWWNCNNPSRETDPTKLYSACGYPTDSSKGEVRIDVNYLTASLIHTYNCSQSSCEYTAKVIVLGGSSPVEAQALIKVSATVANASDTTAPQLSNLQPSGSKTIGANVDLSLITNEKAVCKYATADEHYSIMTDVFNVTADGLNHIESLGSLAIGNYRYYAGCQDVAGNAGYGTINFSVIAIPVPASPPSQASPPAQSIDACIKESSPGKNDRCPVRDQCCQTRHDGYNNYLHYIVNWCGGQYNTSMCSSVPSASGGATSPGTSQNVSFKLDNPLGATTTFQILLNKIIDFIFWVGMALAPVMLIVAGFMYVISSGSPQKVEQAKKIIIYTVIGLIVLLLAKGLVTVLESIIGVNPVK